MNQGEIESWNGTIGERWALFQESLDARIRVYGERVLEKAELRAGMRVLDVGAGCGDMTIDAARTVGAAGHVVGVDVSRPMLARARERAHGLGNLELVQHDAATFTAALPFDAVISRFGVMFFDAPVAAFANLHRVTRPGGGLTFVCWQALEKNPWAALPLAAVRRVLPAPPAAAPAPSTLPAPGPFAFADPGHVRDVLARAGFRDVELKPFDHTLELGSTLEEAVEYASRMGPSARALRDADDATRELAFASLRETLGPLALPITLGTAVWIVSAKA